MDKKRLLFANICLTLISIGLGAYNFNWIYELVSNKMIFYLIEIAYEIMPLHIKMRMIFGNLFCIIVNIALIICMSIGWYKWFQIKND